MYIRFLVLFLILLGSSQAEVLRSIAEVRALESEKAALKLPVEIEAQVLKMGRARHGIFTHDEETGIYMSLKGAKARRLDYKQGDMVRIKGVTNPGGFMPHIDVLEAEIVGGKELPVPLKLDRETIYKPEIDCRWVELKGVIVDALVNDLVYSMRIECFGEVINLVFPRSESIEEAGPKLLNRGVIIQGVAATKWNDQRQMTDRIIQMGSLENVVVVSDPEAELPLMRIDQLLLTETSSLEAVRIRGVVAHIEGRLLYLQAEGGSILVKSTSMGNWRVGDDIEVTGTVVVEPFSPALRAHEVKRIGRGELLPPEEIDLGVPPFPSSWNHELISVEASLLDSRPVGDSIVLNCSSEGHFFEVRLEGITSNLLDLEVGSQLRLIGICGLRSSRSREHNYEPDGISMLLRTPEDIVVLKRPPWWTPQRVLLAVSIAILVIGLTLVWVWLLHKRVSEQTTVIRAQVGREATQEERHRVARELHDSIEQSLSGLALQLDSAKRHSQSDRKEDSQRALYLAGRMLAHCQRESRESIYDLRRSSDEDSLSTWHDDLLLNEAETLGAKIHQSVEGRSHPLSSTTEQHVTKIVREAAINALRHGHARSVDITRKFGDESLNVVVGDDGEGFDTSVPLPRGHFGLHGMRERAQRVGGSLTVESNPGDGTVVTLKVPYEHSGPNNDNDQSAVG